ncbi:MAG: DUF4258 domain-containing protein [Gemmatimonadaceae bacterium]|nr:DUF4258 domain-containing protein [Gemmatimonadaceae bacterium]
MNERPLYPKQIFYSEHAAERMVERGFSSEDVRRILFTGDVAVSSYQPPKGPRRHARQLVLRGHPAKVVFVIWPTRYDIITVEWVTE